MRTVEKNGGFSQSCKTYTKKGLRNKFLENSENYGIWECGIMDSIPFVPYLKNIFLNFIISIHGY